MKAYEAVRGDKVVIDGEQHLVTLGSQDMADEKRVYFMSVLASNTDGPEKRNEHDEYDEIETWQES